MSYIGAQPTTGSFPFDQFSGNGSTTAFTLTYAPASTSSIIVAVSGVVQNPNTYSCISTTLTFSGAPPSGTNNISVLYLGLPVIGVSSPGNTAYFSSTSFTATASQTTFTPSGSYQVGFINVIRNGAQLAPADYTATNGTTVTLNNACTAGDIVVIEVYTLTSISNALPLTGGTVTGATTFNSNLTVNGGLASGYTGFKNRIINGGMVIDQRNAGTAQSITSGSVVYTLDRWLVYSAGGTLTSQRVGSVGAYSLRLTGGAGISAIQVIQRIESNNIADLAGQTVNLSFTLSSSTLTTVSFYVQTPTATDNYTGTNAAVLIGSPTITSTPTQYSYSFTMPATATNGAQIFIQTGAFTSGTLTYTNVQLERGSNATSFEFRSIGQELLLCQRYYIKTDTANHYGYTNNFGGNDARFSFPVTMRTSPSVTTSNTAGSLNSSSPVDFNWNRTTVITSYTASAEL